MPKTRADLINGVLEDLRVIGDGETASAESTAAVDNRIDAVLSDLADRGICYIADAGDPGPSGGSIEDSAFNYLVPLIANWCSSKFGQAFDIATVNFCEDRLEVLTKAVNRGPRVAKIDSALLVRRRGR